MSPNRKTTSKKTAKKAPAKAAAKPTVSKQSSSKKAASKKTPAAKKPTATRADEMPAETLEFITAIDDYKRLHGRPFPSWSEIFEIVKALGYEKQAS